MKLLVIDGNSLVNRAFYGMSSDLSTVGGQPTGAIYGFFTMLNKIQKEHKPQALCVTFDLKAPTFRHKTYEEYKAGRKSMPEELVSQLPILKDILKEMNIPCYAVEGWEADDLMGTISKLNTEAGWETIVATGDRDSFQLITDTASVHYIGTKKFTLYTRAVFEEEYGFPPIHLIDLKAIMGDKSDNIPGVKGLGEKTVMPLIQEHRTIDVIFEKLKDPEEKLGLKPAALKKLREGEEMVRLSYDLAEIRLNAPLEDYTPEKNLCVEPNHVELYGKLADLELQKLIQLYGVEESPVNVEEILGVCEREDILTMERANELLECWKGKTLSVLALPRLSGVAVCEKTENKVFCALVLENGLDGYGAFLKSLFTSDFSLCVHGSKVLQYELLQEGITASNIAFDVELAGYLLNPDDKDFSLEVLGRRYLKFTPASAELYDSEESFSPLSDMELAKEAWVSHTALITALAEEFQLKIEAMLLHQVYYEIELPLCGILAKMQVEGISMDKNLLVTYGEKLLARVEELETLIHKEAGEEFNIASTQQLGTILFEKMELPTGKKTKTGYSTNVEVLEELKSNFPEHKILDYVIEHRHVSKLHSTYAKGLEKVITPQGKIHSTFKNTVTATGRLSSTDPNLQNIPIRTELGAELRYMFVADSGKVLIDADYSQIELRLLAHLSKDERMISAFLSEEDFHTQTASQVFHVPVEDVDSTMRRAAKAVNFGIVYGISAFSLSQDIGVTVAEAKQYITRYFKTYPEVKVFMEKIVETAKETGMVSTLYGRKRWVPDVNTSNAIRRKAGERVAQNMPMQGTAADVMKLAMIAVDKLLEGYPEAKLVLQIHDEIIVECPESQAEELCEKIRSAMESVADFSVPLLVEAKAGKSWGDSH